MTGNPGEYGKKRFERLDYTGAVSTLELSAAAKTDSIIIQLGSANASFMVPKPPVDITLTEIRLMGSAGAATTTTTAYLSVDLVEASSGFGTTTTLCGTVQISATTSGILVEATSSLSASIGATQALIVKAGATTLIDDNAAVLISYTKD